ncbi:MAG TPA: hypothetical protein VF421_11035 [Niabella sp.]
MRIKHLLLLLLLIFHNKAHAQESRTDFLAQLKNYDLSAVIMADHIIAEDRENSKEKIQRAEPIGFIDNDFERLYVHFISVIKNPESSDQYLVFGKTKVKETIRAFQGILTIKEAKAGFTADFPGYQQGYAICEARFYEDAKQSSTGFFSGKMHIGFVIDSNNRFRYDALLFYADYFSNNEFTGTWTSYKTSKSKKCNWGDYRIPDSGDLDTGAGEFMPNAKYFDKGWKSYILTQLGETEKDVQKGKKKEAEKWWEEQKS